MKLGRWAVRIAAVTMVAAAVLVLSTLRGATDGPNEPLKNDCPLVPAHALAAWLNQQFDYVEVPVARSEGGREYRLGADPNALVITLRDSSSDAAVKNAVDCRQGPPCFYLVRGSWRDGVLDVATVVRPLTRDEAASITTARYAKRP